MSISNASINLKKIFIWFSNIFLDSFYRIWPERRELDRSQLLLEKFKKSIMSTSWKIFSKLSSIFMKWELLTETLNPAISFSIRVIIGNLIWSILDSANLHQNNSCYFSIADRQDIWRLKFLVIKKLKTCKNAIFSH